MVRSKFDIPELLDQLAVYLAPPDLLVCVQVSHLWNVVFMPKLWHTINDRTCAWKRILQICAEKPTREDRLECKEWLLCIFKKYGHHIRDLTMEWDIVILAATTCGSCVNLKSLQVDLKMGDTCFDRINWVPYKMAGGIMDDALAAIIRNIRIHPYSRPNDHLFEKTVYVWLLALANKRLRRLDMYSSESEGIYHIEELAQYVLQELKELRVLDTVSFWGDISLWKLTDIAPWLETVNGFVEFQLLGLDYNGDQETPPKVNTMIKSVEVSYMTDKDLFTFLTFLPNLERLYLARLLDSPNNGPDNIETVILSLTPEVLNAGTHLKILHIGYKIGLLPLLQFLPNLTELGVDIWDEPFIEAVVTHCKKIEVIKTTFDSPFVNDRSRASQDPVNRLLVSYPKLRVLGAFLNYIHADELIQQPWVCKGLEKFRCRIVGIERLSSNEQTIYDRVVAPGYTKGLSADEAAIVQKFERGREQQRQVYDRLASLTNLKELVLGYENRDTWSYGHDDWYIVDDREYIRYDGPTPDTMELSLESGLDRLASLKDLRVFGFEASDHRIKKKELEWMVNAWPKLRNMYGLAEDQLYMAEYDQKKAALREYMQTLRPDVKHGNLFLNTKFMRKL
ncbi:hypothetical protein BGZ51_006042 [Haplosporangium sp. Z 767]|nr:hypothetical protein BGZ51_006042 [Haplosporangium sp. Z 767]KAF9187079.1 hypothetical protein BGZ50_002163 [Haplosporangium sp. Z 11]